MAGVPRSLVLVVHSSAAQEYSPAFQCPVNTVTLVKSITLQNRNAVPAVGRVYVSKGPGNPNINFFDETLPATSSASWTGFMVLDPDYTVGAYLDQANMDVYISGAVLLGPPPYPPAAGGAAGTLPAPR